MSPRRARNHSRNSSRLGSMPTPRRPHTKIRSPKAAEMEEHASTYVSLGHCESCNTPRLPSCPNCVDADKLPEQGRLAERAEILTLIRARFPSLASHGTEAIRQ